MSFLSAEASVRLRDNKLLNICSVIDWDKVVASVGSLGRSGIGPIGYDICGLIKYLILQNWHDLNYPAMEDALRIRLDFMVFTGFDGNIPDETTLYFTTEKTNAWANIKATAFNLIKNPAPRGGVFSSRHAKPQAHNQTVRHGYQPSLV